MKTIKLKLGDRIEIDKRHFELFDLAVHTHQSTLILKNVKMVTHEYSFDYLPSGQMARGKDGLEYNKTNKDGLCVRTKAGWQFVELPLWGNDSDAFSVVRES